MQYREFYYLEYAVSWMLLFRICSIINFENMLLLVFAYVFAEIVLLVRLKLLKLHLSFYKIAFLWITVQLLSLLILFIKNVCSLPKLDAKPKDCISKNYSFWSWFNPLNTLNFNALNTLNFNALNTLNPNAEFNELIWRTLP
jgi:hypothetical protein